MLKLAPLALALCLVVPAFGSDDAPTPEIPDLSKYDRDTLQVLAEQLYGRVAELEAKVAELEARIGAEHGIASGGEGIFVDGGTVAVEEGSWIVTIASNVPADTGRFEADIATERQRLVALAPQLSQARQTLAQMEGKQIRNKDGNMVSAYGSRELTAPRATVRKLEAQQRAIEGKIRRLEDEIRRAESRLQISGATDEGVAVTVIARGVYAGIGRGLIEGQTYQLTGRGEFGDASGRIYLKTATPVVVADGSADQ